MFSCCQLQEIYVTLMVITYNLEAEFVPDFYLVPCAYVTNMDYIFVSFSRLIIYLMTS